MKLETKQAYEEALKKFDHLLTHSGEYWKNAAVLNEIECYHDAILVYEQENGLVCKYCKTPNSYEAGCFECADIDVHDYK